MLVQHKSIMDLSINDVEGGGMDGKEMVRK